MTNVTTYFELERDATVKWLGVIDDLNSDDWSLDQDYEQLVSPLAWEKSGSSEFWTGIFGLFLFGVLFLLNIGSDVGLHALIGFAACLCLFRVCQGLYLYHQARAVRRTFTEKRGELEIEPGWLWRYENFIRPELHTFPEFAQESFDGVMRASKAMSFGDDQESLIRYWFWVRIVRDRLEVWKEASDW